MNGAFGEIGGFLARHRWVRRILLVIKGVLWFDTVWWVVAAAAAPATGGNPFLAWITLTDTHGVYVGQFALSMDRGGVLDPGRMVLTFMIDIGWRVYATGVMITAWFIDWVVGGDWLKFLTTPLVSVGDALSAAVGQVGAVPVLLMVSGVIAGLMVVRGRVAAGVWEMVVSALLVAMLGTVLAHPVQMVADPNTGLIFQAQQAGVDLANTLAGSETAAGKTGSEQLSGMVVDAFLRKPTEIINFGQMLDGTPCEDVYTAALKDGVHLDSGDSAIRDAVRACNGDAGSYADQPNGWWLMDLLLITVGTLLLQVLAAGMALAVLVSAISATYHAVKAVFTLVWGILPGSARGPMWMTVASVAVELGTLMLSYVMLAVSMATVSAMLVAANSDSYTQTFVLLDVVMVVFLVVWTRQRHQLRSSKERLARALASMRPGGGGASPRQLRAPSLMRTVGAVTSANALARRFTRDRVRVEPDKAAVAGPSPLVRTVFSGQGTRGSGPAAGGFVAGLRRPGPSGGGPAGGGGFGSVVLPAVRQMARRQPRPPALPPGGAGGPVLTGRVLPAGTPFNGRVLPAQPGRAALPPGPSAASGGQAGRRPGSGPRPSSGRPASGGTAGNAGPVRRPSPPRSMGSPSPGVRSGGGRRPGPGSRR